MTQNAVHIARDERVYQRVSRYATTVCAIIILCLIIGALDSGRMYRMRTTDKSDTHPVTYEYLLSYSYAQRCIIRKDDVKYESHSRCDIFSWDKYDDASMNQLISKDVGKLMKTQLQLLNSTITFYFLWGLLAFVVNYFYRMIYKRMKINAILAVVFAVVQIVGIVCLGISFTLLFSQVVAFRAEMNEAMCDNVETDGKTNLWCGKKSFEGSDSEGSNVSNWGPWVGASSSYIMLIMALVFFFPLMSLQLLWLFGVLCYDGIMSMVAKSSSDEKVKAPEVAGPNSRSQVPRLSVVSAIDPHHTADLKRVSLAGEFPSTAE